VHLCWHQTCSNTRRRRGRSGYDEAKDEPEIRTVFERTLAVRALSPQAKELADRFFFETLVRVHRAGEGAPFTGLKPAGQNLGPAIPAADKAIEAGSLESVVKLLTAAMQEHLREHFNEVVSAKAFMPGDVTAGRAYVKAYAEFIHYPEPGTMVLTGLGFATLSCARRTEVLSPERTERQRQLTAFGHGCLS
jgi:Family of unknown function (DUF6448)